MILALPLVYSLQDDLRIRMLPDNPQIKATIASNCNISLQQPTLNDAIF